MNHSAKIYIVGQNTLVNQLIGFAVQSQLKEEYEILARFNSSEVRAEREKPIVLLLVDDSDANARADLFKLLADRGSFDRSRYLAALFNVDVELSNLCEAVRRGVKGLFFANDSIDRVLKGVGALIRGEVWIPREVLAQAATRRDEDAGVIVEQSRLTMREMEVLSLVASGATNDEIAGTLYISPHTVKTHMYNIFQKIGVENRLHAATWATRYLKGRLPSFLSNATASA